MAEDRGTALARLASIVRLVASQPGISVGELSVHFGRPRRAIRRDIELLDRAGIGDLLPGRSFEIDYAHYVEEERLYLREALNLDAPLPLTDSELVRLVTGLQAIVPTLEEDDLRLLPGALSALIAARGDEPVGDVPSRIPEVALPAMSELTASKIVALRRAIESGRSVSFDYVNSAGRASSRVMRPERLVCGDDGWVVSGWCAEAGQVRTFRVDRLANLASLPSENPARLRAGLARRVGTPQADGEGERVVVTLRPEGRWRAQEAPALVEAAPGGMLKATYEVWDPHWMRAELLSLAPFVVAVEPIAYLEQAGGFARRALQMHRPEGG